jgi:hypothetical protein
MKEAIQKKAWRTMPMKAKGKTSRGKEKEWMSNYCDWEDECQDER